MEYSSEEIQQAGSTISKYTAVCEQYDSSPLQLFVDKVGQEQRTNWPELEQQTPTPAVFYLVDIILDFQTGYWQNLANGQVNNM